MKKSLFVVLATLFTFSCLNGCFSAASMASRQKGVTPRQIKRCEDHDCFVFLGGDILKRTELDDGGFYEIYRVKRDKGSTLRSFTHGILSVGTLGIWNVVAVPIEGFASSKDHLVFKVTYDKNEKATKVEIQG